MVQKSDIVDLTDGFGLGEWLIQPRAGIFRRNGHFVHVEPKVMDVLICLAQVPGEVVTREELLNRVWQRVVVTDEVLTRCISELRTLLGDTSRERRYVRTVPKRGYSLLVPVETHSVTVDAASAATPDDSSHGVNRSIAVLPFVDMSPRHDNEYFSDGLTEELINVLTQVTQLRVAARTSTFFFKGRSDDIQTIGEKLNVRYILEGCVRRAEDKLRITAQLVNVEDGFQRWSETFDCELNDILAIQEQIARAVASRVKLQLGVNDAQQFMSVDPAKLDASKW